VLDGILLSGWRIAAHMNKYNLSKDTLFLVAKAHSHLQYYLRLNDTLRAANQDTPRTAKVIKIRAGLTQRNHRS